MHHNTNLHPDRQIEILIDFSKTGSQTQTAKNCKCSRRTVSHLIENLKYARSQSQKKEYYTIGGLIAFGIAVCAIFTALITIFLF